MIEVVVWGRPVGAVARNPATGNYAFEYTPDWVRGGVELAPLHMPLEPTVYEFPGLAQGTFHRLPPLLADSLPDAFGNALVNRWMAERGIAAERITPQARHIDESDTFPRALFDELAAQGWLGARVAPEFGGAGCDAVTACLILEEVSRASGSVGNSMNAHLSLVSTLIADHGSDAQ
ncbi:MAG TPA: hypothetical protein DCR14_11315, partial [Acidimicrobiaceae bacterium]|nr:hypothetical protein [Acidimicrobiaceae bacterium]